MALRQLVDDRQRALAMAIGDRLAALHRRVEALAAALHADPAGGDPRASASG